MAGECRFVIELDMPYWKMSIGSTSHRQAQSPLLLPRESISFVIQLRWDRR